MRQRVSHLCFPQTMVLRWLDSAGSGAQCLSKYMEPGRPVINRAKLPLAELANTEPLLFACFIYELASAPTTNRELL